MTPQAEEAAYQESCLSAIEVSEPGWADAAPGTHHRVAVVIGVQCYDPRAFSDLLFPAADADLVATRLRAEGFAVDLLVGAVRLEQVRAALDEASERLHPGGTLVIYYAGHSWLHHQGSRFDLTLVLGDTGRADPPLGGLPVDELAARVGAMDAAHRIVILDSCNAALRQDAALGRASAPSTPPSPSRRYDLGEHDLWLYAADAHQVAVEERKIGHGRYTAALFGAFDSLEADRDGDGVVGFLEAHDAARRHVTEISGYAQTPQVQLVRPVNPPLRVPSRPPGNALAFGPREGAGFELVWRQGDVPTTTAATGLVALSEGLYDLDVHSRTEGPVRRARVRMRDGAILDVSPQIEAARTGLAERYGAARLSVGAAFVTTGGPDVSTGEPALQVSTWWNAGHEGDLQPAVGATVRTQWGSIGNVEGFTIWMPELDVGLWYEGVLAGRHGALVVAAGPTVGLGGVFRHLRDPNAGSAWTPLLTVETGVEFGLGFTRGGGPARTWLVASPRIHALPTTEDVAWAGSIGLSFGVTVR